MKAKGFCIASICGVGAAWLLAGCSSVPEGAERGPHNTMAYDVLVTASSPGARIQANGAVIGNTPVHLKIFGDPDGTFHDFGSDYYIIEAIPLATNQFAQVKYFQTGHLMTPEDRIPQEIYFDMNQPPQQQTTVVAPPAVYGAPPPVYYGAPYPYYYGPGYYGPGVRLYFGGGPRFYHHYRRW